MPPQARRTSPNYLLCKVNRRVGLRARSHVRVAVLLSQALMDEKPPRKQKPPQRVHGRASP
jgi:hypothetical protein